VQTEKDGNGDEKEREKMEWTAKNAGFGDVERQKKAFSAIGELA